MAVEPRLEASPARVTFHLDVSPGGRLDTPPDVRRRAAEEHLETLPSRATWIWSDGSAEAGVTQGGGGAFIRKDAGEVVEVKVVAGQLCSSTRAELIAAQGGSAEHQGW